MAYLVGKFLVESTYSESPLIPSKLASNMTSISGLAGNLGDTALTSVGCARFEFILPALTASGVDVSRVSVLVSAWNGWEPLALAGKVCHSYPSVRMLGENSGASG